MFKFLKLQFEIGEIRDSLTRVSKAVLSIQSLFRHWKKSQDSMILMVTQIWLEERDKIISYCIKKPNKAKKLLQKKVQAITPGQQIVIIKSFIKRCIFKYQTRYINWEINVKSKNETDEIVIIYVISLYLESATEG